MKISTINSIETSSVCNLSCQYCPSKSQGEHRSVGVMQEDAFEASIDWVKFFCQRGTQRELNLFGVGEPLLNPRIVEFVELARRKLPFRQILHLNTNGKLLSKTIAQDLKKAGITQIDITGHVAYDAAKAIRILREVGIAGQFSMDFITAPNNWAGQVEWFEPDYSYPCQWLDIGQVMIMSSGDVTTCCLDAFGQGIISHVFDDITQAVMTPHALCSTCHHVVMQPGILKAS